MGFIIACKNRCFALEAALRWIINQVPINLIFVVFQKWVCLKIGYPQFAWIITSIAPIKFLSLMFRQTQVKWKVENTPLTEQSTICNHPSYNARRAKLMGQVSPCQVGTNQMVSKLVINNHPIACFRVGRIILYALYAHICY